MLVRMTQQIQGNGPDGNPWPAPGTEINLPDGDARSAIRAGTAVDPSIPQAKVLVPPAGIHVPGITAAEHAHQALVEVPQDALADPHGVRRALDDVNAGNYVRGNPNVGHQHADGSALTVEETKQQDGEAGTGKANPTGGKTPARGTSSTNG